MMQGKKHTKGFTLIELIIVIVIIGILAGIAIPRFINQTTNARKAALAGVAGAMNSAVMLVYGQAQQSNATGVTGTVTMADGTTVNTASSYPSAQAGGIGSALNMQGFVITAGGADPGTATFNFAPAVTNCNVTYTTGAAPAAPVITVVNTGC